MPELFGGAADLSESNLTDVKGDGATSRPTRPAATCGSASASTRWAAIANGIAYHGGFIPYAGTFLNFSDYMRGSVRLAALSGLHVIYVWTHDSVGLGEDGPTHQPVEHYAALRAMPNLWFVRPGDANEATRRVGGSPCERARRARSRSRSRARSCRRSRDGRARPRGRPARRLRAPRGRGEDAGRRRELLLIATGSELQLAFAAAEALEARRRSRRASSRCRAGSCSRRRTRRTATRAAAGGPAAGHGRGGRALGWERYAGDEGAIIGIDHFGASAPGRHDLREVRVHVGAGGRRRAAGRPRGPPRPPARRSASAARGAPHDSATASRASIGTARAATRVTS